MKIGYQGIKGSYSESAINKLFGSSVETIGFDSFEKVFTNVKKEKISYGVIPVENSTAGSITKNYDLLLREDAYVIAEIYLKVNHYLLGIKESSLGTINSIYSHPQALAQCEKYIKKNKWKIYPEFDTAGSAKLIKNRLKINEAAIASERCSKIYNLKILAKEIGSSKNNTTRFFVFTKKDKIPKNLVGEKTSIVFKTKHSPGALVDSLKKLSDNEINLTKIESRPNPRSNWDYFFYVDFEGSIDNEKVKKSLKEMEESTEFIKILGSYPFGKR